MLYVKKMLANKFVKNVIVLASGAAAGQIIIMAAMPTLTRLYSPESFGMLAAYAGILGVLNVISSARYELAIPLSESDNVAASLLVLSSAFVLFSTLLTTIIVFFLHDDIGLWLNSPDLSNYLWLLPVGVMLNGLYNVSNYWAVRTRAFKAVAKTKIPQATFMVAMQLMAFKLGSFALIVGHTVGQSAGVGSLWLLAIKQYLGVIRKVEYSSVINVARRYRRFPFYSTWAGLLNSLGAQAPNILFAMFFGPASAGFFFIANRILTAPMSVLGNAIGQSFFAEAPEALRNGTLDKKAIKTVVKLFLIIIVPASVVAIFGSDIFSYALGDSWVQAGVMAQVLTPMIVAQFITSPVGQLLAVKERQTVGMCLQGVLTSLRLLSIFVGQLYFYALTTTILYSLSSVIGYILFLYFSLTAKSLNQTEYITPKEN